MIRTASFAFAALAMLSLAACSSTSPTTPVVSSAPPASSTSTTTSSVTSTVQKVTTMAETLCSDAKTGEVFVQIFDPSLISSNKSTVDLATAACAAVGAVAANLPSTTAAATTKP